MDYPDLTVSIFMGDSFGPKRVRNNDYEQLKFILSNRFWFEDDMYSKGGRVVSLSKTHLYLLSTGLTQEDLPRHN